MTPLVSFLIPHLGREEGLRKCIASLKALDYPEEKIEILVDDREEPTVPEKVEALRQRAKGDWYAFAANDTVWSPSSLRLALDLAERADVHFVGLNSGRPDQTEHFIIHRDLVDKLDGRQIFDTDFFHCGADNYLVAQCEKLGEADRCEEAIVEHNHFTRGAEFDWVYQRGWAHVEADRDMLKKKLATL